MGPDIRALTGLRGIAAALVVAYHYWPSGEISGWYLKNMIGRGYLWVDLFFVLSGYVMALNYAGSFVGGFSRAAFADFLMRRIARIYPLYFALLAAQLAYTLAAHGGFQAVGAWAAITTDAPVRDIPANVLMVQSLGLTHSMIGQAWSISTEFGAYLVFPLLIAITVHGGRRTAALSAAASVALLAFVVAINLHDTAYHSGSLDAYDGSRFTPLMRCLGSFTLGLLTFRIGGIDAIRRLAVRDGVGFGVLGLLAAALVAGVPDLGVVALFPPLVLVLAANAGGPALLFANPAAHRLGIWSYAVYLLHPLLQAPQTAVRGVLADHLPANLAAACATAAILALLLALACAAYHLIEVPGRRAVRNAWNHARPAW